MNKTAGDPCPDRQVNYSASEGDEYDGGKKGSEPGRGSGIAGLVGQMAACIETIRVGSLHGRVTFEPKLEEANRKREQPVRGGRSPCEEEKEAARWLEQSERGDGQRSMEQHCEGSLSLEGLSLRL